PPATSASLAPNLADVSSVAASACCSAQCESPPNTAKPASSGSSDHSESPSWRGYSRNAPVNSETKPGARPAWIEWLARPVSQGQSSSASTTALLKPATIAPPLDLETMDISSPNCEALPPCASVAA